MGGFDRTRFGAPEQLGPPMIYPVPPEAGADPLYQLRQQCALAYTVGSEHGDEQPGRPQHALAHPHALSRAITQPVQWITLPNRPHQFPPEPGDLARECAVQARMHNPGFGCLSYKVTRCLLGGVAAHVAGKHTQPLGLRRSYNAFQDLFRQQVTEFDCRVGNPERIELPARSYQVFSPHQDHTAFPVFAGEVDGNRCEFFMIEPAEDEVMATCRTSRIGDALKRMISSLMQRGEYRA